MIPSGPARDFLLKYYYRCHHPPYLLDYFSLTPVLLFNLCLWRHRAASPQMLPPLSIPCIRKHNTSIAKHISHDVISSLKHSWMYTALFRRENQSLMTLDNGLQHSLSPVTNLRNWWSTSNWKMNDLLPWKMATFNLTNILILLTAKSSQKSWFK